MDNDKDLNEYLIAPLVIMLLVQNSSLYECDKCHHVDFDTFLQAVAEIILSKHFSTKAVKPVSMNFI